MGLNSVFSVIVIHLSLGLVFLIIFDLLTKRIRSKFDQAVGETQQRLLLSGNPIGSKASACLFVGAMWLFWPLVFVGALLDATDKKEDEDGS